MKRLYLPLIAMAILSPATAEASSVLRYFETIKANIIDDFSVAIKSIEHFWGINTEKMHDSTTDSKTLKAAHKSLAQHQEVAKGLAADKDLKKVASKKTLNNIKQYKAVATKALKKVEKDKKKSQKMTDQVAVHHKNAAKIAQENVKTVMEAHDTVRKSAAIDDKNNDKAKTNAAEKAKAKKNKKANSKIKG